MYIQYFLFIMFISTFTIFYLLLFFTASEDLREAKEEKEKKIKNKNKRPRSSSTSTSKKSKAALKLVPELEAASIKITQILTEEAQNAFNKEQQKSIKKLLKQLHSYTETMTTSVANTTGKQIFQNVK